MLPFNGAHLAFMLGTEVPFGFHINFTSGPADNNEIGDVMSCKKISNLFTFIFEGDP